jgi:hypothetical protein
VVDPPYIDADGATDLDNTELRHLDDHAFIARATGRRSGR